ncbi:MAG: thiamine-phosphate kinase [Phycisphaerales bacterium]|nr:MAG: thiamine-phosphate kinase [Phycisphaerales bacterium]
MTMNELEFVEWLRGRQREHPAAVLGIGDDMEIVRVGEETILLSSDMLLDGVHFDTFKHDLALIGRKAIACSLSDCAAMAVQPVASTISIALSAGTSTEDAQELFRGASEIAAEYDLAIAGGDTTSWSSPLAIDVSIVASPFPGIEPVTRAGAKAGDTLYVTGPLGGSLLGRHLTFTPRVKEAKVLAETLGDRLHAMMDISDGLSLDLWRLCWASGVGATLDEQDLQQVVSDDAQRLAERDGRPALEHALTDGEDFELLLAACGQAPQIPGVTTHRIGTVTDSGLLIRRKDGQLEPLEPKGFVH